MALKKATVTISKVFSKKLDKPDVYENTFRHSFQAELEGTEIWFNLPANKMDAIMVEESDQWKIVGVGSTVFIKYDEVVKGDTTYRNVKKSDFTVTDLVEGTKYIPQQAAPAANDSGKAPGKVWKDNAAGQGVGSAINNAVSMYKDKLITEDQFPSVVSNLYAFSVQAIALAEAKEVSKIKELSFSFTGVSPVAEKTASKPKTGKASSPKVEKVVEQPEDTYDNSDSPF